MEEENVSTTWKRLNDPDEIDTGLHEYSYWSTVANRLLYSSVYTSIYVTAFVIQSIIFIATCIHVADLATIHFRTWFILLDVFVTLLLAAEVAVRVLAMREKFWHSWLNIVDLCVLGLCSILFFCWIFNDGAVVAGEFLLSVRYGVQLVRMVMMMKEHQRRITIVSSIEKSVDLSAWDTDQLPPLSAVLDSYNPPGNTFESTRDRAYSAESDDLDVTLGAL